MVDNKHAVRTLCDRKRGLFLDVGMAPAGEFDLKSIFLFVCQCRIDALQPGSGSFDLAFKSS